MCGPAITGREKNAGSRMLWPPRLASVPPMNTTSASGNKPLNSPMVSTNKTHGSGTRSPAVKYERRMNIRRRTTNLFATMSNRSGLRGTSINSILG